MAGGLVLAESVKGGSWTRRGGSQRTAPPGLELLSCHQKTNFTPSCTSRIGFLVLLIVP